MSHFYFNIPQGLRFVMPTVNARIFVSYTTISFLTIYGSVGKKVDNNIKIRRRLDLFLLCQKIFFNKTMVFSHGNDIFLFLNQLCKQIEYLYPRKRSLGVYRNYLVCLSERLSVQNSCPIHTFLMENPTSHKDC